MSKPTDFELAVCSALQAEKIEEEVFDYYGDEFYPFVKEYVPFLKEENHKKTTTLSFEGLKKKDKIIKENTVRLIQKTFTKINFDEKNLVTPPIFGSRTLENRAICFMYLCVFFLKNMTADVFQAYSVIVSIQRFIKNVKDTPFSKVALLDLTKFCEKLIEAYGYNGKTLYEKTPELITKSPHDNYVPMLYVKPYPHQKEAVDLLRDGEYIKDGFVCIYSLSTNSGKTFTATGIASRIEKLDNVSFIFCCELLSVRQKVETLLLYSGIRKALVYSPEKAYEVLSSTPNSRDKFVLFIDEITLNAHLKSDTLKSHMKLFSVAPKWVYISGANLDVGKMTFFSDVHRTNFTESKFRVITSETIFSSVSAYTFGGNEVLPHMFCKTLKELKSEMTKIVVNQFKGRLYTPGTVGKMLENAKKVIKWSLSDDDDEGEIEKWMSQFPNIATIFKDVSQIYPDNIRKIAMSILEIMVKFDDDYCVEVVSKTGKTGKTIDLFNLNYELFPNNNIVAHPDPEKFAIAMFAAHIAKVKKSIGSCDALLTRHRNAVDAWEKNKEAVLGSIKDEKERLMTESELFRPEFPFPAEFQINTKEYCKSEKKKYRKPMELEKINTLGISEELLILLYSGVGVYSSKASSTNAYTKQILNLVAQGKLEFLVTDVCYGFDYPFGCLFITKEFFSEKSTTDIFQLMSRIGRGRLSYSGEIYMDNGCAEKIFGDDNTSEREIENMYEVLIGREWEEVA